MTLGCLRILPITSIHGSSEPKSVEPDLRETITSGSSSCARKFASNGHILRSDFQLFTQLSDTKVKMLFDNGDHKFDKS